MAGRQRREMTARLLHAANRYGAAAAAARAKGAAPMRDGKAKAEAASLVKAALEFRTQWARWRAANGRPPSEAGAPMQPPKTPEGEVIRNAKELGWAKARQASPEKLEEALKKLMMASEKMERSRQGRRNGPDITA